MTYEKSQRLYENKMRTQAQAALASRGILPTETAIHNWNLEQRAAAAAAADKPS
jgi:hypothetical protein